MIEAELPDGTILEFPPETSTDVVQATVKRYLNVAPSLGEAFGAGIDQVQRSGYGALAGIGQAVGSQDLKQFGLEGMQAQDAELQPITSRMMERSNIEDLGDAARFAKEQVVMNTPNILSFLGPGLALRAGAKALGATGALATTYAPLAGASLPQQYGANISRQAQESGVTNPEFNNVDAALAALGQAALESSIGKILPFKEGQYTGGLLKRIGQGALKGMGIEVPTEITQQMLERWQAGLPLALSNPDVQKEILDTAASAGVTGGALGTVSGAFGRSEAANNTTNPSQVEPPAAAPPVQTSQLPAESAPSIEAPAPNVSLANTTEGTAAFAAPLSTESAPGISAEGARAILEPEAFKGSKIELGQDVTSPTFKGEATLTGINYEQGKATVLTKTGEQVDVALDTLIPGTRKAANHVQLALGDAVKIPNVNRTYIVSSLEADKVLLNDTQTGQNFTISPFEVQKIIGDQSSELRPAANPGDIITVRGKDLVFKETKGDKLVLQRPDGRTLEVTPSAIQAIKPQQAAIKIGDKAQIGNRLATVVDIPNQWNPNSFKLDFGSGLPVAVPTGEIDAFISTMKTSLGAQIATNRAQQTYERTLPEVEIMPGGEMRSMQGQAEATQQTTPPLTLEESLVALNPLSPEVQARTAEAYDTPTPVTENMTPEEIARYDISINGNATPNKLSAWGRFQYSAEHIARKVPALRPLIFAFRNQRQRTSQLVYDMEQYIRVFAPYKNDLQFQKLLEYSDQFAKQITELGDYTVPVKETIVRDAEGKIIERTNYVHTTPGEVLTVSDPKMLEALKAVYDLNRYIFSAQRDAALKAARHDVAVGLTREEVDARLAEVENSTDPDDLKKAEAYLAWIAAEESFRPGHIPHVQNGNKILLAYDKTATGKKGELVAATWFTDFRQPGSTLDQKVLDFLQYIGLKDNSADARKEFQAKYGKDYFVKEIFATTSEQRAEFRDALITLERTAATMGTLDSTTQETFISELRKQLAEKGFKAFFTERKNIPGYRTNYVDALVFYAQKGAHSISRLEADRDIQDGYDRVTDTRRYEDAAELHPQIRKWAENYFRSVTDIREEFAAMRSAASAATMGFNLSSLFTDVTQTITQTLPLLSSISNPASATAELSKTLVTIAKIFPIISPTQAVDPRVTLNNLRFDKAPKYMQEDLKAAARAGKFFNYMVQEAAGTFQSGIVEQSRVGKAFDSFTNLALALKTQVEVTNRLMAWVASYETARKIGPKKMLEMFKDDPVFLNEIRDGYSPAKFANFATDNTQFVGGKVDRPEFQRGVGALLNQFIYFTTKQFESISRGMGGTAQQKRQAAYILGSLLLLGGFNALPWFPDLNNISRIFGLDIAQILRQELGDQIWYGPYAANFGINLSDRLRARQVPQLEVAANMRNQGLSMTEAFGLLGPAGIFPTSIANAIGLYNEGRDLTALYRAVPVISAQNIFKAADMPTQGVTTLTGNSVLAPQDVKTSDVVARAIGFETMNVTRGRNQRNDINALSEEAKSAGSREKNLIVQNLVRMLQATTDTDRRNIQQEVREQIREIQAYNAQQPDRSKHIQVDMRSLIQAARAQIDPQQQLRRVPLRAREEAKKLMENN